MSDIIAVAAPVGNVFVAFHQTYPEAVGGLAAALLALVLDGITGRVRLLSDNPWLVNILRAGVARVGVAVRDAGSKR
jgi:hypothetical protein